MDGMPRVCQSKGRCLAYSFDEAEWVDVGIAPWCIGCAVVSVDEHHLWMSGGWTKQAYSGELSTCLTLKAFFTSLMSMMIIFIMKNLKLI